MSACDVSAPAAPVPLAARLRQHLLPLFVLNAAAALVVGYFLNGRLGEWGGDNVTFLLLTEALAGGRGYVDLQLPGAPLHVLYPPVYPLLLLPGVLLGLPLIALKGWTAVLSVGGLNAAYFFFEKLHGRVVSLLITVSTLCCGTFLDSGLSIMSEGPYLLISLAALLAARRSFDGEDRRWALVVTGGLLAGLAILTRVVGVTLIPGIVFFALVGAHRRLPRLRSVRRLATLLVLVFVVVAPWFARSITAEGPVGRGYFREFTHSKTVRAELKAGRETGATSETPPGGSAAEQGAAGRRAGSWDLTRRVKQVIDRPVDNLWDFAKRLSSTPMPRRVEAMGPGWTLAARSLFIACCALLGGLGVAGLLRALLFRRAVHDGYFAAYCAVLLIWIGGGFRLVMPVLPFLFAYVHEGVVGATRLLARKFSPRVPSLPEQAGIAVLAFAILANLAITLWFPLINERLNGEYKEWWSMYLRAVCRVGTVADPGDTVIAVPDSVPSYLVGLQAARLRKAAEPEKMVRNLLDSGAEFLVTTPMQRRRYGKAIERAVRIFPEHFELLVGRFPVRAYRILRPDGEPDPARSVESGTPFGQGVAGPDPNLRSPRDASLRCSELLPSSRPPEP